MIEVPRDPVELCDDVVADRGRDVQVIAGEIQVHQALLEVRGQLGSGRLAQVDGRDLQRLPVFGDRSPGDDDALFAQEVRDPAVRSSEPSRPPRRSTA
jgi:hypothetical protein